MSRNGDRAGLQCRPVTAGLVMRAVSLYPMPSAEFESWWNKLRATGDISPVRLGCRREDIRALFGEPDDVGGTSRMYRTPAIWKYGQLEFHFGPRGTDVLELIYSETPDGGVDVCIPSEPLRTVNRIPLDRLWNECGDIEATRDRFLSEAALREMLRRYPVEFYVADIGHPLRRVDAARCYDFWKSEAEAHVVDDPESGIRLDEFPGEFAYVASEWSGEIQIPIVLLEKHH